MSDYDEEDINDVALDSSDDDDETIRWAYQDAKNALLSEESNAAACFQRVLTMEQKKGFKTVWGFKALKHLVVASIQANDFDGAAGQSRRLVEYSDVVSSTFMEPAIVEITMLSQDPRAALMICQATYKVRKPTMTWMARCIALLSDVQHTKHAEVLAAALESASELRNIISDASHLDDATRQSHLLSIDAITAELRLRRQEFEAVYSMYQQLDGKSRASNPGAVAAICEIFAKALLSPSSTLTLDRPQLDPHSLAAYCLVEALELYPRTDTQAHVRCWRYWTVNQALRGASTSSNLARPDAFEPETDAVVRLAALYIDDHGDLFLEAWEQARDGLADPFLQEFFDACAASVRTFRKDLQEWRHLFEARLYSECYLPLRRLDGDLRRPSSDNVVTMDTYAAVRDTRLLIISAAEMETFGAEGRQYNAKESFMSTADAYRQAQKIDSRSAAIVCEQFGQNQLRRGHPTFAREQLSRALTLFADKDPNRRRECAVLLAFCNYFQVCRVKYRLEEDVETSLSQEECEKLKELAATLRRADAQGFKQLLQNGDLLRLGNFMHDLLRSLSAELTNAMRTYAEALELRASGKLNALCALIKDLHATCSSRGLWFHALRVQISAFVATYSPEVGRNLWQIYEEGRELENCQDTEVLALSVMHDSWGRWCLCLGKFDAAGRHFEKALRAYESNVTATDFLGASFLAFTSLVKGETPAFDEAIVRFARWLSDETKAALRRFYHAFTSEDLVAIGAAVTELKGSNGKLANVAEHYASVLHNKLQTRQLGGPLVWTLVFERLGHRDLHDVQRVCRNFRSIVCLRLRHAPIDDIVVSAQLASWRHVWVVQCRALCRASDPAPISTVELVDRLEQCCGSAPIPKLVIRGDAAPLDHPQLLEYAARHELMELVLEMDLSGLAYEPLRRFLHGWKSIDSLTISTPNAADSVCVSDRLLGDAAACGIEKVAIRCERAAGITDEGIMGFWLSGTCRSLEVIRPTVSQDFLRRLVQACPPFDADSEATLTVYASKNVAVRQLNWDDGLVHRKAAQAPGTTYEFAANGVAIEVKISLNEYCRLEEVGPAREYDVMRVTRRRVDE